MADVNYKLSLEGIQFHIVSVGRGNTGHIKMHSHSIASYEIHYIESGQGVLRLRRDEYTLKKGTFYLTGPGIAHEQITISEEPMREIVMYYTVPLVCGAGRTVKAI
ncbi:MAG: AraC family ligand binding domain-containing protein [Blautia marasmi]